MSNAVIQRNNLTNFQSKSNKSNSYGVSQRVKKGQLTSPRQINSFESSPLKCSDNSIRKSNKPLMEKKRRQRINRSLDELKKLITDPQRKDSYSKLEKADILDMTVKYIRSMNQNRCDTETQLIFNSFLAGFGACEHLSFGYLSSNQSFLSMIPNNVAFLSALKNHLSREKEMATLRHLHNQCSSRPNNPAISQNQLFVPPVNPYLSPAAHPTAQKVPGCMFPNFPATNPLLGKQPAQQQISQSHAVKSPPVRSLSYSRHEMGGVGSPDRLEHSPAVSLNGSNHSTSSSTDSQNVWRPW